MTGQVEGQHPYLVEQIGFFYVPVRAWNLQDHPFEAAKLVPAVGTDTCPGAYPAFGSEEDNSDHLELAVASDSYTAVVGQSVAVVVAKPQFAAATPIVPL